MQVPLCSCCLDWGFIVLLPMTFASFPQPCCPETGAASPQPQLTPHHEGKTLHVLGERTKMLHDILLQTRVRYLVPGIF